MNPDLSGHEMLDIMQDDNKISMAFDEFEFYEEMESMADEVGDAPEIKGKKKQMARAALTLWKEKQKSLEEGKGRVHEAISKAKNEVYQLVGFYNVFAGVVFTAVATSNRLECHHLWSPVGLCLFTCLIITFIAHSKFRKISRFENIKKYRKDKLQEVNNMITDLKTTGYNSFLRVKMRARMKEYEKIILKGSYPKSGDLKPWKRSCTLIPLLTIFTTGIVISFVQILCKSRNPNCQGCVPKLEN